MELYLEITAVGLNLVYLFFLIRENIWCWFFGIAGSVVSIFLFYSIGLYSESILYVYYVLIGMYGYHLWRSKSTKDSTFTISTISLRSHVFWLLLGVSLSFSIGFLFGRYTDASSPYLDATTTVFSFIASYLEARKVISAWLFWIVINAVTLYLYLDKDLNIYFGLTLIYLGFSFVGYRAWNRKMHMVSSA